MVKVRVKKFGAAKIEVPDHPEGRKLKQKVRKDIRKIKLSREQFERNRRRQALLKKCLFFQRQVLARPDKAVFDLVEISQFIRQYIGRFDNELSEIANSKRSKYKQASNKRSREEFLKAVIRDEINNFSNGAYDAPDLTNPEIVTIVREWNGAVQFLDKIVIRSYSDAIGGTITTMPGYSESDNDDNDGDDNDNDGNGDDNDDDDDNDW